MPTVALGTLPSIPKGRALETFQPTAFISSTFHLPVHVPHDKLHLLKWQATLQHHSGSPKGKKLATPVSRSARTGNKTDKLFLDCIKQIMADLHLQSATCDWFSLPRLHTPHFKKLHSWHFPYCFLLAMALFLQQENKTSPLDHDFCWPPDTAKSELGRFH